MARTPRNTIRLIGASTVALAAGLGVTPAFAQNAFQGTPTVQSGSVTFGGTVGQDVIAVASNQAVIDWVPNDTAGGNGLIDFLPNANVALFKNDATLANDFTVLNRILPVGADRPVALNGTIQARFEDMVSGALTPGGGVWFYSPNGIQVGATATIDVGRLALLTADPFRDASGNFIIGGTTQFQAAESQSFVINSSANITATPENSYVMIVAPNISQ
jgi:filamentous hemagglutinin family protein